jgi:citronellol/citronellal dehydrogenase
MTSSRVFREDLLAGEVCLVTGGGTGLGAAIARELGRLGARVHIASRKASNIEPAAAGLSEELGAPVTGHALDIRDREACARVVGEVVAADGRLDILVNNGGGQFMSPAEAITPKGWDAVVATNLTGTWNMTRAAADGWMLKHGGRVANITMLAKRTFPGMVHSMSARAGVEAMTRTLAVEWAARGVRLNCVAPGLIATNGMKRYPMGLDQIAGLARHVPAKRFGSAEEVAWLVAYLVSPAAAYVTGQTWTIDGGKELWGDWWPIPDPPGFPEPLVIPPEPWEDA